MTAGTFPAALVGAPPGVFFKDRDPIHFLRHKGHLLGFVTPMVASVLASAMQLEGKGK